MVVVWVGWILAAALLDFEGGLSALLGNWRWTASALGPALASVLAFAGPPLAFAMLSHALLLLAWRRERAPQLHRSEIARMVLGQALLWIALLLVIGTLSSVALESGPPLALLLAAVAITFVALAVVRSGRGLRPFALHAGPLRDRAFELAKKAGARLQRIYVLPAERLGMANAFARAGNTIMLTDVLVRQLNRREVDAVVAHELAHLRHRHPLALTVTALTGLVLAALALSGIVGALSSFDDSGWLGAWQPALQRLPVWWLAIPVGLLLMRFLARRFERTADAQAAELTGDPEATISALGKLARLGLQPLDWGSLSEASSTHPSMRSRALSIGLRYAIPFQRIDALLTGQAPLEDEGSPIEDERYDVAGAVAAESRNAGPAFRRRTQGKLLVALLLTISVLPPLLIAGLRALGLPDLGSLALAAALATGCWLLAARLVTAVELRRLEAQLERQARASDWAPLLTDSEARWVGFAPTDRPMLFESMSVWDHGWLVAGQEGIAFFGERVQCLWRWESLRGLGVGAGPPDWWRSRGIYLHGRDAAGIATTVHFLIAEPRMIPSRRTIETTLASIERRRNERSGPSLAIFALGPWDPTTTTGATSWLETRRPGRLVNAFFLFGALSFLLSLAFGTPFWSGPVTSAFAYTLLLLPVLLYREKRTEVPLASSG